jgi:Molybdopterin-binding protein
MKYGAKNQLTGKVTKIKRGSVMAQVDVSIPAKSAMCSVLTLDALDGMELKKGDTVRVVAKSVNVLLIKE